MSSICPLHRCRERRGFDERADLLVVSEIASGREHNLWTVERESAPVKVTGFKTGRIDKYAWSLDSKSVVFTYGTASQGVVLISGYR